LFAVFLFLALFSLLLSQQLYHTVLSPIGIFGALWNGLLALFEARLLNYDPLSAQAYLAFIGSFVVFVCGVLIATLPALPLRRRPWPVQVLNLMRARHVLNLLNALSLLGLLLTVIQLVKLVGWGALFNTMAVRQAIAGLEAGGFGGGLAGYSLALVPLAGIVGGIYLAKRPSDHLRALVCLAISAGSSVLTGNRSLFIWTLVLLISAYVLTRVFANGEPVYRVIRPLVLAGAVLFVVFAVVGTLRFSEFSPMQESDANVELPWFVLQAYHYVTSGLGAFSAEVAEPVRIDLPGIHTFTPIVRAIAHISSGLGGYSYQFIVQYTTIRHSVLIPVPTNVFTYLAGPFDDVGWWGVGFVPFGIGLLSGFTFLKLIKCPSFGSLAFYSLICLQFVYSAVVILTYFNLTFVVVLGLLVLRKYVSRKRNAQRLLPAVDTIGLSK
jgi:oligosaccharide repeat unit polymerase